MLSDTDSVALQPVFGCVVFFARQGKILMANACACWTQCPVSV